MRTFAALIALLFCTSALADDEALRRPNDARRPAYPKGTMIEGPAVAIDGDTILVRSEEHGDVRVRIWGLSAPEMKDWPYGNLARGAMDEILDHDTVAKCIATGDMTYKRPVAKCTVKNLDIAMLMIRAGFAVEYRTFSKGYYLTEETGARKAKRGVWGVLK